MFVKIVILCVYFNVGIFFSFLVFIFSSLSSFSPTEERVMQEDFSLYPVGRTNKQGVYKHTQPQIIVFISISLSITPALHLASEMSHPANIVHFFLTNSSSNRNFFIPFDEDAHECLFSDRDSESVPILNVFVHGKILPWTIIYIGFASL